MPASFDSVRSVASPRCWRWHRSRSTTSRIKDLANIEGVRRIELISSMASWWPQWRQRHAEQHSLRRRSLPAMLERIVNIRSTTIPHRRRSPPSSVTSDLQPSSAGAGLIDVTVSALGDAECDRRTCTSPCSAPTAASVHRHSSFSRSACSRALPPRHPAAYRDGRRRRANSAHRRARDRRARWPADVPPRPAQPFATARAHRRRRRGFLSVETAEPIDPSTVPLHSSEFEADVRRLDRVEQLPLEPISSRIVVDERSSIVVISRDSSTSPHSECAPGQPHMAYRRSCRSRPARPCAHSRT